MYQICGIFGRCLNIYLEGTSVVIEDKNDALNKIKMSMEDWQALKNKIKNGEINNLE